MSVVGQIQMNVAAQLQNVDVDIRHLHQNPKSYFEEAARR